MMKTSIDEYGRTFSPELMKEIEGQLQICDQKKTKEEIIHCKFDLLYDVTHVQDIVNIGLMKTLNDSDDNRWIPVHMMDNANAIMLGISRNKGRPLPILRELYVAEKVDALNDKWNLIKMKSGWSK
jgi:hypothetical protein